ncbi:MAG TPA: MerR family transcriptional regulator [Chitinophagaceae bacterium]|nr:MerR family transcriptional regulator [Chitinophagaceae bacterium]
MNDFTIRDLENLSGIKAHTIRIWEQRYSFLKPKRTGTNIRCYNNEELKVLLSIALLNKYGYKISQIDKMSGQEMNNKILTLTHAEAQQDKVVHDLIRSMVDLDMDAFEGALDHFIYSRGIDKAITQAIFPFLERVGLLWMTGHINPAQEHLASNIIRQKILVGIEGVLPPSGANKLVLLFLPEGEHHELGLLYTYYLLKTRGVRLLYLGADVPFNDLVFVAKFKKPDFIYTHLTSKPRNFNLGKFLAKFTAQAPGVPLVISGQSAWDYIGKDHHLVQFKSSLQQVREFIDAL